MAKIIIVNTKETTLPAYAPINLNTNISVFKKNEKFELSWNTDKGLFTLELSQNELSELNKDIETKLRL